MPKAGWLTTSLHPAQCWNNTIYLSTRLIGIRAVFNLQDTASLGLLFRTTLAYLSALSETLLQKEVLKTWVSITIKHLNCATSISARLFPGDGADILQPRLNLPTAGNEAHLEVLSTHCKQSRATRNAQPNEMKGTKKWIHFLQADVSLALQHAAAMFQARG